MHTPVAPRSAGPNQPAWPRAILFDVGDTLVCARRPLGRLLAAVSQQLQIALPLDACVGLATYIDEQVMLRTTQGQPFTFPASVSQRFWLDTYHGYLVRFLADADAERLAHALRAILSSPAGYVLFNETLPILAQLRADGYRLGIISNWEAWLPSLLTDLGIVDCFDHVVISGLCGVEKPDPRIFTRALDEGGHRPEDVIYVGDRPAHDVDPPRALGITPILLDRTNAWTTVGARRITTLAELPSLMGARTRDSDAPSER